MSTEDFYRDFPSRAVPADVHGILLRVAALEDTLAGKIKAWSEPSRWQSKQAKDFTDIVRLVEAHPRLWSLLPPPLQESVRRPG
ncbi:MAG: nucleotidyl transferase AbiEii/AbiGii toxin family protein [Planctomycetia bacterium]